MKHIRTFDQLNEGKAPDRANEMVSDFVEGTYEGRRPNSKTMNLAIKGLKQLSDKTKIPLEDLVLTGGSCGSDYIFIEPVSTEADDKPVGDIIVDKGKLTVKVPSVMEK